jgi:hypothetical protein
VTILRKKFSPPIEVAARRDGGIEVYDIGNNATLAGYANTAKIPVPAAGWGATQELRELYVATSASGGAKPPKS